MMVFITLSSNDARFGQGEELAKNTFLTKHGLSLFFYDSDAIEETYVEYGLITAEEISEPKKILAKKPSQVFWQIICKKA